ncbi:MAG: HAMP domain-containing protein, partial [Actinomycetota bacterium]
MLLLFGIPAGFGLRYAQVTDETNSQVAIHNLELLQIGGLVNAVHNEQMQAHEVAHTSRSRTEALGSMTSAINGQEQLIRMAKEDVFASEEEEELAVLNKFEQLHSAATARFLAEGAQAIELGDMARLEEEADVFKGTSEEMLGLLDRMTEICTLELDEATAVRDAALNRLGTAAIVSFIAASLLLLGVAALVSRWITRPLRQMVIAAQAMREGDLGKRVETAAKDEVGQLAGAFNTMADSLGRRTGELTRTNETIERRRAELEALNTVSEVVAGTLDLKEMTDAVLDKVLEVIKADAAAIHLLDDQTGEVVLTASRGLPDVLADDLKRLKPGQGCPGYVWEIGSALVETDLRESDKVPQSALDAG